ncbi:unnamed protein product [Blumeria hordei]|uniref:RRM domain-containing protein n=2 Tax=Blumeria hordei TaxID=2867405 RepID=A0A383UVA1_BLUHO|nr:unnamed protein product [Blumeria hordei]
MAPSKPVVDFNAIVQADRRRRKNEIAAQKIFGKARRHSSSGIASNETVNPTPSLASRVGPAPRKSGGARSLNSRAGPIGITKRTSSAVNKSGRIGSDTQFSRSRPEWADDSNMKSSFPMSSHPPPRGPKLLRSNFDERPHNTALIGEPSPALHSQLNIAGNARPAEGLSIRGLAGPYRVMVKNLAAGTTAADIESAMMPVGGVVLSCRLVAERPRVIAEVIFETKEGADNVVETFNNQSADGNILHVYHKLGPIPRSMKMPPAAPSGQPIASLGSRSDLIAGWSDDSRSYGDSDLYTPRGRSRDRHREYERDEVMDGSYGFDDRLENYDRVDKNRVTRLYSDSMIGANHPRGPRGDRGRGGYR